ncbi:hypothetical protein EDD15DRAFT_2298897 [Pisolithus albus]|nr:hypothetical protein EDD15DRAFT_2298897 [Pisolithus albus]
MQQPTTTATIPYDAVLRVKCLEMIVRSVRVFLHHEIVYPSGYCRFGTMNAVWGQCTHVYHMHCLFKWLGAPMTKQQCPLDRRP